MDTNFVRRTRTEEPSWLRRARRVLGRCLVVSGAVPLCALAISCSNSRELEELQTRLEVDAVLTNVGGAEADGPATALAGLEAHGEEAAPAYEVGLEPNVPDDSVVLLEQGACVGAIAVAEAAGSELTLELMAPDGRRVAEGAVAGSVAGASDAVSIERFCVDQSGVYAFRLRSRVATSARLRRFDLAAEPGDAALSALAAGRAAGESAMHAPQTNALREGRRHATDFVGEAGVCYRVLAAGLDTIDDLDIYVRSESGLEIVQELGLDAQPVTERFCLETTQRVTVEFRAHRGQGSFRWQIFRSGVDEVAAPVAEQDAESVDAAE